MVTLGLKTKATSLLKYLKMLKRWLPDISRLFPYGSTIYFVQDSAVIYHGTVVKDLWMEVKHNGILGRRIELAKWTPYSPDLNPIEYA